MAFDPSCYDTQLSMLDQFAVALPFTLLFVIYYCYSLHKNKANIKGSIKWMLYLFIVLQLFSIISLGVCMAITLSLDATDK